MVYNEFCPCFLHTSMGENGLYLSETYGKGVNPNLPVWKLRTHKEKKKYVPIALHFFGGDMSCYFSLVVSVTFQRLNLSAHKINTQY